MKHSLFTGFLVLALWGCKKGEEDTGGGQQQDYDFSALTALIEDSLSVLGDNVVVIVQKDGQRIYERSWGNVTPTTIRPLASATKLPSALLMLTLHQDGTLDLDEPIGNVWPAMNTHGKGAYTVRNLFCMASGMQESTAITDPLLGNTSLTLQQVADSIAETFSIWFPLGTYQVYGGAQMFLAGATAEVASGQTWPSLFQSRINGPLGHTALQATFGVNTLKNPGGGLSTSPNVYMSYLELVRRRGEWNGTQLIRATLIDSLFLWQYPGSYHPVSPYPFHPPYHPYDQDTVRYGFGSWLDVVNPGTGQVEQISSAGAFGTYPWVDRSRGLTGIIFTFVSDGSVTRLTQLKALQLIRWAVDAVHGAP